MKFFSFFAAFGWWSLVNGSNLAERDLASTILQDIEGGGGCAGCESALILLKGIADIGDAFFVSTLTEICILSKKESTAVCKGAIALEGPLVAQALREITVGSETSQIFCITFFGLCSYPQVDAWSVPFPTPKPAGSRPVPSGQAPIKFVHFSDIHVDPFYVPGSSTNCTDPICCRNDSPQDAPGANAFPAGAFGDHNCDAPVSLETSLYSAIKEIVPDAQFAVFTGDIVDHGVWNTTEPQNTLDIQNAYARMQSLGMPIFGVMGNHESSPTNAFAPSPSTESQWIYNVLTSAWSPWISPASQSATSPSPETFGAYSTVVGSGLRIISVNTNLWYTDNYYLYTDPMEWDPSGQLAWMVSELDAAEKAGQRAYIIGHMPSGVSDALHNSANYFDQIINRYSNTIAGLFFGHTHWDHFQLSYSDYASQSFQTASATTYICPSLTPTSGYPAFRVYTVDPVTFAILDAETYLADMTNPAFQTSGPVWTKYYSAKDTYGPLVSPPLTDPHAELSPAFWHNVTTAFASNANEFQGYWSRKQRGWDVPACDATCQTAELCQIRAGRSESNCVTPSPGINFKKHKRDEGVGGEGHHPHADLECGHSVLGDSLGMLTSNKEMLQVLAFRARMAKR